LPIMQKILYDQQSEEVVFGLYNIHHMPLLPA